MVNLTVGATISKWTVAPARPFNVLITNITKKFKRPNSLGALSISARMHVEAKYAKLSTKLVSILKLLILILSSNSVLMILLTVGKVLRLTIKTVNTMTVMRLKSNQAILFVKRKFAQILVVSQDVLLIALCYLMEKKLKHLVLNVWQSQLITWVIGLPELATFWT